ncbi:zinc-binding alcohol dehydrogenase [Diaminobutyricimonas sp. LJ205]|uniref:zinc-dependent alcohol dehydrogenase n=1 Tax=Diaminobutyricimonas sp. LJ205 TaxID=2683590 RepID=UPI0012F48B73|nr:zinc-binding alcohol dehydrogenase [Diaminobutyricimonas sp. LJ205]
MNNTDYRIVFAGKDDCQIEEFVPVAPAEGEVRVKNIVSLMSAGTELAVLRKTHRAYTTGGFMEKWIQYPFYPGYAAVGRVTEVGSGVTGLSVGDVVWHSGQHATSGTIRADVCELVPEGIAPEDAVFFGLVQIAMTAVRRAPIVLGESVLVSGLGLVGVLCSRLYQIAGADLAVADLSTGRLERAERMGASSVVNLSETSLVDWYESRPDQRPDVSIEAAGVEANIDACLKATKNGGRVVLLGSPRRPMEIDPYTDIHLKGLTVIGAHTMSVDAATRAKDVPYLFALCGGPLGLDSIRTHVLPFTDAPRLYDGIERDLDEYLGVVLRYED